MIQLNDIGRDAAHAAGARGVTDVTGFGLAGHATEMATASQVTVVLHVDRFPELPGALALYRQGFKTRANKSNREYLEPVMRIDDAVDRDRLELAFDPQTSGGLLISVSAGSGCGGRPAGPGRRRCGSHRYRRGAANGRTCPWSFAHEHDDGSCPHRVARLADRDSPHPERRCRAGLSRAVSTTSFHAAVLKLLNLEQRVLPVGVDHDVEIDVLLGGSIQAVRQLPGFRRHVDVPPGSIPADIVAPEATPRNARVGFPQVDHEPKEAKHVAMLVQPVPIQPRRFIVLVVRVVVASLRVQELVAGREHRCAVGEHQQAAEVPGLLFAQRDNASPVR